MLRKSEEHLRAVFLPKVIRALKNFLMSKWLRYLLVTLEQTRLWQSNPKTISNKLSEDLEIFMHSQSRKEKIELLEKQISVVTRRVQECRTDDEDEHYSRAYKK
jgi:hypothetical protein